MGKKKKKGKEKKKKRHQKPKGGKAWRDFFFPSTFPGLKRGCEGVGGVRKGQDPQEKIFPSFVHFLIVREETGSLLAHLHAFDLGFRKERGGLGGLKVLGE